MSFQFWHWAYFQAFEIESCLSGKWHAVGFREFKNIIGDK